MDPNLKLLFTHFVFSLVNKVTEPKIKWQNSKATDRLRDTLMSDPNHKWWMMSAHDIFQEDELIWEYPTNCADRLRRLKTAIRGNMEKIAFNNNAVPEHKSSPLQE